MVIGGLVGGHPQGRPGQAAVAPLVPDEPPHRGLPDGPAPAWRRRPSIGQVALQGHAGRVAGDLQQPAAAVRPRPGARSAEDGSGGPRRYCDAALDGDRLRALVPPYSPGPDQPPLVGSAGRPGRGHRSTGPSAAAPPACSPGPRRSRRSGPTSSLVGRGEADLHACGWRSEARRLRQGRPQSTVHVAYRQGRRWPAPPGPRRRPPRPRSAARPGRRAAGPGGPSRTSPHRSRTPRRPAGSHSLSAAAQGGQPARAGPAPAGPAAAALGSAPRPASPAGSGSGSCRH